MSVVNPTEVMYLTRGGKQRILVYILHKVASDVEFCFEFNPFPNDRFLDSFKLKDLEDDNFSI